MKQHDKITIAEMPVPGLPGGSGEFEVQLKEPGIVRHVAYTLTKRLISTKIGREEYDENLVVYVEIDPGAPLRNRRFVVMRPGQSMAAVEGYDRVFCGVAQSKESGSVAYIYELRKAAS